MTKLEKVINGLEACIERDCRENACTYGNMSHGCLNALYTDALKLLKERQWVSVKDRLPEGDGELYGDGKFLEQSNIVVLYGKDPYGRRTFGIGRWIYDHMDTKDSGWSGVMDDDWEASLCTVTHWVPLPEPPKEGDERV